MIPTRHPASLRDPAGYLYESNGRLYRLIRPEFSGQYRQILESPWMLEQCSAGNIIEFRILQASEASTCIGSESDGSLCLEHKTVNFPSYPYEWPLEMLAAAAAMTLDLCISGKEFGYGLKDASPYNILFRGTHPVFIDILSFEYRDQSNPIWLANGQFIRNFLIPLLLDSRKGLYCHNSSFLYRDGIEPNVAYRQINILESLSPSFFNYVTAPVFLDSIAEHKPANVYSTKNLKNTELVSYIIDSVFKKLLRASGKASKRRNFRSVWFNYNKSCTYSSTDMARKKDIVAQLLRDRDPKRVLDVGCNVGVFSLIAAKHGAEVVAIDTDPIVVGSLWTLAHAEGVNVLPLVVNLARPSPALGWRNKETLSFIQRAEGYFDMVMMLAVIHHMLVIDQIPLTEIIDQAYRLTTSCIIFEYVGPDDQQFKRLTRGRDSLYSWFNRNVFEDYISKKFDIANRFEYSTGSRCLYLCIKRHAI